MSGSPEQGPGALASDLYELTMAVSYLRRGMHAPATFSLFCRALPPARGYLVACGLADCLDLLAGYRFTGDELAYLVDVLHLSRRDSDRLAGLRFTGDVWAVPEGRVVGAGAPLLEVTAPIAEAQLVETALLNFVTFQTAVASKAARCRLAAPDARLIDFSMRRTQSLMAAGQVARATAVAGWDATSNVAAARALQLRPSGTMAHSYVEAFATERAAFAAFAEDFPRQVVLLVDTYDTLAGVRTAVDVLRALPHDDPDAVTGIRLDSGDLGALSVQARALLDAAGLRGTRIVASGSLDEYAVAELVRGGAPIDAFGIGTRVGTSADAPYLDTAYKLVQYGERPVFKLSAGKATLPGAKQVFRGRAMRDRLGLRDEPAPPGTVALLEPVMVAGRPTGRAGNLTDARRRCAADLDRLPAAHRSLHDPVPLAAELTPALREHARRAGALVADR